MDRGTFGCWLEATVVPTVIGDMSARRPIPLARQLAAATFAIALAGLATPASVAAHVNRTAGPYDFLVVLVEEPTFEDNHAGFQFWVRRDGVGITGLERTVHAQAAGHGQTFDLVVPPVGANGFYVLDRTSNGVPFDPLGGGAWVLNLTGTVESTPINVLFPVVFPTYPRIGTPATAAAAPAATGAVATTESPVPWPLVAIGGVAIIGLVGLRLLLVRGSARAPS